jgi:hypothetical protein
MLSQCVAQLKLLKQYAAANGFAMVQEYVDVKTAKQTGRAAFGEMVTYLKGASFRPRDALSKNSMSSS